MSYPADCGREAVASTENNKDLPQLTWVVVATAGVGLVGGAYKLFAEVKSTSAASRRPPRPWEHLP